ncbi:MAG: hypothetical protein RL190_116 [Actinomycetota bacterium]
MDDDRAPGRGQRERRFLSRRWLDATDDRNVLIAPVLSIVAFALIAIGDASIVTRVLALLVQVLLFQIVVTAHIRSRRLRRLLFIAAPLAVIGTVSLIGAIAVLFDDGAGRSATGIFSAALAIGVIIRLFGRVVKAPVVNLRVVGDAIAVYLMMGLTFAYLYLAIDAIRDQEFFVQGPQPAYVFLYFSYITLATVGFGDFTAADAVGRLLAMVEGLIGQLYLVTVLALIVSNLGRQRKPAKEREAMRRSQPDGETPPGDSGSGS